MASRLLLEGPIKNEKTSFMVSARRAYADIFMRPISSKTVRTPGVKSWLTYYFADVNGKINRRFSDKDRLFFSVYYGRDRYKSFEEFKNLSNSDKSTYKQRLAWGNVTSALRWNHQFSPKLFSNTTLTYSRYNFKLNEDDKEIFNEDGVEKNTVRNYEYLSDINDWGLKVDFDYASHPNHFVKFGLQSIYHKFQPGVNVNKQTDNDVISNDTRTGSKAVKGLEMAVYIEDDIKLTQRLKANLGLRATLFQVNRQTYNSLEPRLAVNYNFVDKWSLKASYTMMTQYLHLLANEGIGLPTDLWVSPTDKVKPQRSWQVSAGIAGNIKDLFDVSIEGYYKEMSNLIAYKEGASYLLTDEDWQEQVAKGGQGESYGVEFFVRKKQGKFTGWAGYTLSWSNITFDELNFSKKFPYKYDRRNDFSISLMYEFNEKISISGNWVYGTGNSITLPQENYPSLFDGLSVTDYAGKNGYTLPAYHRMDIGVDFKKQKKRGFRTINVSLYNAYSRRNVFYVYLDEFTEIGNPKFKGLSLFPILPSVSYNLKF